MSPNYPEHYYSPTDIGYVYCLYTINVPEGKRIHLVFQELNLVFSDWDDFLEVCIAIDAFTSSCIHIYIYIIAGYR